jgi:DNA-binding beta-propeller fold protein YncE
MFSAESSGAPLNAPLDMASDSSGNIYVADTANHRILVFGPDGTFSFKFGKMGDKRGQFKSPCGLFIDTKNNIWIADTLNNRIQQFNSRGRHILTVDSPAESPLKNPKDVAIDSKGRIYVVDSYNHCVKRFDPIGKSLEKIIGKQDFTPGNGKGEFNKPDGITIDSLDNKYIVDTRNMRVQIFDADDSFKLDIRQKGDFGSLLGPTKICLDNKGFIYIVDCGQIPLVKFDSQGKFTTRVGELGRGQRGKLTLPSGVAVLSENKLAVIDRHLGNIQIFSKK